ncbi:AsmA family protein [Pararcticibacter amylolyticus]|uniref:DUF748 domain-containing protein n=1 Tax=Pararcticibacter amylolyticus TaxID=2173175 RepID=A0A2U2PLI9_9SPHI|nr:hypothetical protein [Pararcticibacter amylolyticus]PWG82039.1 hypothetical protein DDR33_03185 [Pararcticibacter amylolyticus]
MKKKILVAGIAVVLVALGSYLYLKFRKLDDFEPQLKEKLQQIVAKGSNGLYKLNVEKINADVVDSRIILSNIHITYDSVVYQRLISEQSAPANVFDIKLRSLAVDGITPKDLITRQDIRLNVVLADKPVVNIYHHKDAVNDQKKEGKSVYQLIREEIGSFGVKKLSLKEVDFTYHKSGDKVQTSFKDLMIDLDNILIDEETQHDTSRFLYAKDALISLRDFKHKTADSIYNFRLDSISIHAARNEVNIKKLRVEPRAGKMAFRKQVKTRKDRYDITINNIVLKQTDWWRFIQDDGLFVEDVWISNGRIEIYSDKGIPGSNEKKIGNYPHQQLFKMDMPLFVKKINVRNLDITYSELNIKTGKEGDIIFQNTFATVSNITNMPEHIVNNGILKIDATTQFMKTGSLKAGFRFNLARQKEGIFSVYADLQNMNGTALNAATVPLGSVEIQQARINRFKADIDGNNYTATGRIFVTYDDLKISVLKKDDEGKLKKRGLVTFIANNFKINESYPKKDKKAETFPSSFRRPLNRSFFSLIWKTIFNGLKEPVGI